MKAEKVLKYISFIVNENPNIKQMPAVSELTQSLKEEIALEEQKKAGKGSRFKAALKFSKKANRHSAGFRPGIAGAYVDENGKQYITDGFSGVRYDTPFEGLVEAEKGERPSAAFDQVIGNYNRDLKAELPSIAELKSKLKVDKAEGNVLHDGRSVKGLGNGWYDTEFLIQLIEMVEPTEAYFSDSGDIPKLVVFGDGAKGFLFPMRKGPEKVRV